MAEHNHSCEQANRGRNTTCKLCNEYIFPSTSFADQQLEGYSSYNISSQASAQAYVRLQTEGGPSLHQLDCMVECKLIIQVSECRLALPEYLRYRAATHLARRRCCAGHATQVAAM
ncbi:hypothetical protein BAUCODRAFT_321929 [Baudoinia panamericana UAMH 10762]|uniref:Uncharacterized protein n=1 Tax=Baudoinia panamericana (strain UAMH 10762) TaxID=717646 RepID=M2LBP3_BAUPA|nr:uncharacterized protein BAUCODRAFT_321929 [Baudoinia panamericana UAMH 10762]EMC91292.1 hypothetical protein BAUCODRAFT_321929 [Baudoinia panamericana UAMH 10762]